MLYLRNTQDAQVLMVPKNGSAAEGDLQLLIRDTVDHQSVTISATDLNTSALYANIAVELPESLAEGEYQYSLMSGAIAISTGLLYIGELERPDQYEETINYKQYES